MVDLVDLFLPFLVDFAFMEGAAGCAGAACVAASPAAAELVDAPDVPSPSLGGGAGGRTGPAVMETVVPRSGTAVLGAVLT